MSAEGAKGVKNQEWGDGTQRAEVVFVWEGMWKQLGGWESY